MKRHILYSLKLFGHYKEVYMSLSFMITNLLSLYTRLYFTFGNIVYFVYQVKKYIYQYVKKTICSDRKDITIKEWVNFSVYKISLNIEFLQGLIILYYLMKAVIDFDTYRVKSNYKLFLNRIKG